MSVESFQLIAFMTKFLEYACVLDRVSTDVLNNSIVYRSSTSGPFNLISRFLRTINNFS